MAQLLRRNSGSALPVVAAEVLEVRALLSSGTASVHSAIHHAAVMTPATHSGPGRAEVVIGLLDDKFDGRLTVSTVKQTVGAPIQVHFKLSNPGGTISISITGKFASIDLSHNPPGIVALSQVKGTFTSRAKVSGHIETEGGPVSNVVIYLNQDGTFSVLTADFLISLVKGTPPSDAKLALSFEA